MLIDTDFCRQGQGLFAQQVDRTKHNADVTKVILLGIEFPVEMIDSILCSLYLAFIDLF